MEMLNLEKELQGNSYPGRGIIIGRSADGTKEVRTAETVSLLRTEKVSALRHLIRQSLQIQV